MKILKTLILSLALVCNSHAEETNKQVQCLTVAVFKEARGESYKGKVAVAQVVMNRARHFYYPPDICKVITQKHQFSWYKGNTAEYRKLLKGDLIGFKPLDISAYQESKQIALKAFYGLLDPIPELENSLWFTTKDVKPGWTGNLRVVARIGEHVFYAKKAKRPKTKVAKKQLKDK